MATAAQVGAAQVALPLICILIYSSRKHRADHLLDTENCGVARSPHSMHAVACKQSSDNGAAAVQDTQLGAALGGPGAAWPAGQATADGCEGLLRLHREGW